MFGAWRRGEILGFRVCILCIVGIGAFVYIGTFVWGVATGGNPGTQGTYCVYCMHRYLCMYKYLCLGGGDGGNPGTQGMYCVY